MQLSWLGVCKQWALLQQAHLSISNKGTDNVARYIFQPVIITLTSAGFSSFKSRKSKYMVASR